MTAIARFYNTFLSFIELDPTLPTHICKFSDPARPDPRVDPTRVQLWVKHSCSLIAIHRFTVLFTVTIKEARVKRQNSKQHTGTTLVRTTFLLDIFTNLFIMKFRQSCIQCTKSILPHESHNSFTDSSHVTIHRKWLVSYTFPSVDTSQFTWT